MYKVFIFLFVMYVPAISAVHELPPSSSFKDAIRAIQSGHEPNELVFYPSIEETENASFKAYASVEETIRAHLRPDSPPLRNDIPISYHHLRRLATLSIYGKTFKNFLFLRDANLDSLRMYNCQVTDFNTVAQLSIGIRELHLRNCQIKDISSLSKFRILVNLSLTDNNIDDISILSNFRNLAWLDLRNNNINSVSALKPLRKLTYVDLRNNQLSEDSVDMDIRLIKANNPGVRVLLGKQSISKSDLERQLSARAKLAEFALCARLQYKDEIQTRPFLPHLSDDISEALKLLQEGDDMEYLADIAAMIIKYSVEVENYYRPGPVLDRYEEALLGAFLDGIEIKERNEGYPVTRIADWICDNRKKLAPSVFLDMQIERLRDLRNILRRKEEWGRSLWEN